MPHSQPFKYQPHKWFSVLLILMLPFYVFYKWITGDLPDLRNVGKKT